MSLDVEVSDYEFVFLETVSSATVSQAIDWLITRGSYAHLRSRCEFQEKIFFFC